jgi:hypothetical protein
MRTTMGVAGAVLAITCVAGAVWAAHRGDPPAPLRGGSTPVIVELFSSEGCSSCPPADTWLSAVDRLQPVEGVAVVVLEEHVDYWDRLGWRDPFGQAQFGERQAEYARALSDRHIYTPEIVVDGTTTVQSGDQDQAAAELRTAAGRPRARVTLSRADDRVTVDAQAIPGNEDVEVWFAVTESGLSTDVQQGENAGHHLAHAPVVRALRKLGVARGGGSFHVDTPVDSEPTWAKPSLRLVAFVQQARSRHIVGAGAI